jgi:hypothetical protein
MYFIYTSELPTSSNATTSTLADDSAILATHVCPGIVSMELQASISKIDDWAKKMDNCSKPKQVHACYIYRTQANLPGSANM